MAAEPERAERLLNNLAAGIRKRLYDDLKRPRDLFGAWCQLVFRPDETDAFGGLLEMFGVGPASGDEKQGESPSRALLAFEAKLGQVDAALGDDTMVLDRTIDVHVRALRRKMGEHAVLIETVRGVGYKFRE